jgi:hypothetical protein
MLCAGQAYHASITVQDLDGPPAAVVLTITKPDATLVDPPPVPSAWVAGGTSGRDYTCYYDYVLPTPGLFKFAWTTQGPNTAPTPTFENVRDYISVVGMGEIKLHLNKRIDDDDELAGFMMAATELVENKVGICVPRRFTDRCEEGRWRLLTEHKPVLSVISVTSVWPGGPSWATPQLRWDGDAGIIDQVSPFPFWWAPWDIVYTCGRPVIAERWIHAAKEQVRHLWETQRGGQPPALLQGEEEFTTTAGFTFSVPRRVLELLQEDMVPSS